MEAIVLPFVSANLYLNLEFPSDKKNGSSNLKVLYPSGEEYPKNAIQNINKSKNIWLKNHGDRLDIAANIATIESDVAPNFDTSAKFAWTFDIFYYSEGVQDSYTDYGLLLNYISNAQ